MIFSTQQSAALLAVQKWLEDPDGPQVFHLFGYAGSGKTTLALEIRNFVKGEVIFGAFTGKAALVMRQKGCKGASTIHSMIYKCVSPPFAPPKFELNEDDSPVIDAKLVIIDECSMVGQELGEDLLSLGKRVLVLGDPAQLPPIDGAGFFDSAKPEVMLTDIHRQAQNNPIIRMSMDIRSGKGVSMGLHGTSKVIQQKSMEMAEFAEADQVLVGLNRTRRDFNERMRVLKNFMQPDYPIRGEKVICLRNNREKGLLNGGLWEVKDSRMTHGIAHMDLDSHDVEDQTVKATVPVEFFAGQEARIDWRLRRKNDEFDYGYAITVHKSQGSQWPNVLVFNENRAFRENASRWLYTAVTRASERVTIVI